jgi:hypothetical protein
MFDLPNNDGERRDARAIGVGVSPPGPLSAIVMRYGRQRGIDLLFSSFEPVVAKGTSGLVLVSGYSGHGKSSAVSELHRVLVLARGRGLAGQRGRSRPPAFAGAGGDPQGRSADPRDRPVRGGCPASPIGVRGAPGLCNVHTRASQIDGKLDIHTAAGHGTSIVLTVPIPS